jgi:2-keto-4-pentenoate hydratase/2-oxohepta-3-ene-1,7-dioic acid hydratase in catechol pathway
MKLASFSASGRDSYGAAVEGGIADLGRRLGERYPTLRAAIAGGALGRFASEVKAARPDFTLAQVTLLPPITDPDKIICAGRNYRAHAAEAGGAPPENPQVFLRLVNTLVAHDQPMVCPKISGDFDYEGELALIIGKPGRHIAKADALSHIFGYTLFNDGSIRDIQFKHSIAAGKNFYKTGGFGPWIVTADEIPDPTRLQLATRLNGREVQHTGIDPDLVLLGLDAADRRRRDLDWHARRRRLRPQAAAMDEARRRRRSRDRRHRRAAQSDHRRKLSAGRGV